MTGALQTIPARHGTATFVPKGHSIRIINTYGTQVVDTWAFALHKPPQDEEDEEEAVEEEVKELAQREEVREEVREEDEARDVGEAGRKGKEDGGGEVKGVEKLGDDVGKKEVDGVKDVKGDGDEKDEGAQDAKAADEKVKGETEPEKSGEKVEKETDDDPPETDISEVEKNAEKKDAGKGELNKSGKTWSSYVPSLPSYGRKGAKTSAEDTASKANDTTSKANPDGAESPETAPQKCTEKETPPSNGKQQQKSTWGSYIPSMPRYSKTAPNQPSATKNPSNTSKQGEKDKEARTWSSYFPSGISYTSYLPDKGTLSAFAGSHHRDPTKSYAEQLYEFSKTPVGAASLSAATGSGTASTLYAAYTAYQRLAPAHPSESMQYLSLPHTRASTLHLIPLPGDTLLSNTHNALLTLTEDTSPGAHDTLMPACDPAMYRGMGVEKWAEHGSCAENLVLALKGWNERAGLRGRRAVGADVTVHSVPAPLGLWRHVVWDGDADADADAEADGKGNGEGKEKESGSGQGKEERKGKKKGMLAVREPKLYPGGKMGRPGEKGGWVRFRAERDCVVVMSACPMEEGVVNGGRCMVGHFVVEGVEGEGEDGGKDAGMEGDKGGLKAVKEGKAGQEKGKSKRKAAPPPKLQRGKSGGQGMQGRASSAPKEDKNASSEDPKPSADTATKDGEKDVPSVPAPAPAPAESEGAQTPKTDASGSAGGDLEQKAQAQQARKKPKKLERRS